MKGGKVKTITLIDNKDRTVNKGKVSKGVKVKVQTIEDDPVSTPLNNDGELLIKLSGKKKVKIV